ncbi:MAG: hypothetical protein AABX37_00860 [Nanoarchaeota archaeon]
MFCTTCGTLLQVKKTEYGKWMSCPNGHTQPKIVQDAPSFTTKNRKAMEKIEVFDGINSLAVHDHVCKRCGYDKAELIEMSASYSDEDNTYRMKCGKCGFVEQLEGKVR